MAEWKELGRPTLQVFVDRLPGLLLEEKEFSLAWHYWRADPEQVLDCLCELLHALAQSTRFLGVQVLEGNKVLEVYNTGVSKGTEAVEWLGLLGAEFVLAIGDDQADEELFRVLPVTAHSERVEFAQTAARHYMNNHKAVRRLLQGLLEQPGGTERPRPNSDPGSGRMDRRPKNGSEGQKGGVRHIRNL